MPNQTLIAVPADVTETGTLQWFLSRLVEELDLVLGFRGSDTYVKTSELEAARVTLTSLDAVLSATNDSVEALSTELATTNDNVAANVNDIAAIDSLLASTVLDASYHNFDDAVFATLAGRSELITLGSNLSNTPYTPVGGETYYNYFNTLVTSNGGVVQELKVFSSTTLTPTAYFRIGNTWTEAKSLGWT